MCFVSFKIVSHVSLNADENETPLVRDGTPIVKTGILHLYNYNQR